MVTTHFKSSREAKTSEQRLRVSISILILVILCSTFGYWVLDPRESANLLDALYMTFITVATVGFKEVYPLTDVGKLFTVVVIGISAITIVYTIGTLGQFFMEGELREIMGRRQMDNRIRKMKEHYIVAGFGRVGQIVSSEFQRIGVPHIVIENSDKHITALEQKSPLFIVANATDDDVLIEAGIQSAKGIVSTIPSEADSVFLTLTARQLNPGIFIIARADSKSTEKKLLRAGADRVVMPHEAGGKRMALTSLKPTLVDCLTIDSFGGKLGLALEEVEIRSGSMLVGKRLLDSELRSKHNISVIAIRKPDGDMKVSPSPEVVIDKGDTLILVGETLTLEKLDLHEPQ